ncbi:MAG TPA: hypothetical protein PKK95_08800 [Vicinamibacterales bacterium]|nr:hypothetical protein [Vicinamibacterales bacterium]
MTRFAILMLVLHLAAAPAAAQDSAFSGPAGPAAISSASSLDALKVFLDCKDHTPCYHDYVRVEIDYVEYVNVREAADVHVLVTSLGTGAGGREFALKFIGQGRFRGVDDEVLYASLPTDTEEGVRQGFVRTLKLGLVRYVLHTAVRDRLSVLHEDAAGGPGQQARSRVPNDDPWDHWVLRARFNAYYESEASASSSNLNGSVSANRVTDAWKFSLSSYRDTRRSEYTFSDGTFYVSTRRGYDVTGQAIRSLGGHWAAGGKAFIAASTYENKDRVLNATGAIEYNVFPYAESTRRQLTLQYLVGITAFDYNEETVLGKLSETVPRHTFRTAFDMKQTWGSLSADLDVSQYLHDTSMNRRTVSAEMDVRLFRGFALNLAGRASSIHDQLYLPVGEASAEEVIARQRQLATSFRRSFRVGVSYTFGSIFSSVVNTRLSNFVGG